MGSMRRNMPATQRDVAMGSYDLSFDARTPPKLSHGRSYLAFERMIGSLASLSDFSMAVDSTRASIQTSSRPAERSKVRGLQLKRILFHFFICFMFGIFVHFSTFVSVDVPRNLASKHMTFSFEKDVIHKDAHRKLGSVKKPVSVLDNSPPEVNRSLGAVAKYAVKKNATESLYAIPVSHAIAPSRDLESASRKLLIIVTPTYARPFQACYLNRLAQTLRSVPPPLLWIVVEMRSHSSETADLLRETGVMFRHLVSKQNLTTTRHIEVHQRNVALSHIEKHQLDGIVHFADDDRMYSVELFDQMRQIRRFGTWPVAVLTETKNKVALEGPVCNGSQVVGWHTSQRSKLSRRFHVDMSGFAFNSTILWDPKRWMRSTIDLIRQHDSVEEGFQETTFIEQLLEDESQMECLPNDCSRIMVWHLHVEDHNLFYPKGWSLQKNLEVVAPLT